MWPENPILDRILVRSSQQMNAHISYSKRCGQVDRVFENKAKTNPQIWVFFTCSLIFELNFSYLIFKSPFFRLLRPCGQHIVGQFWFFLNQWCFPTGCPIIIWTGLNIKIGIVQKVYEWSNCPFAKMIPQLENRFGKIPVWSLIYFLNYAYFDI